MAAQCLELFGCEHFSLRLNIPGKLKSLEIIEKPRRRDGIRGAAYERLGVTSIPLEERA